MDKKPKLTPEDKNAFEEAMRGVKRLTHTKLTEPPKPAIIRKKRKISLDPEEEVFPFSDFEKFPELGTHDLVHFSRPGIQHKILRKLRLGQYNVEARLDLHGMTAMEARTVLGQFLLGCEQQGIRHVIMIHGKGRANCKPILKNKLNHWLRQTEQVLAFCSASPKDGSSGALYVLLRKGK